jgi:UbiD family decarboxylase
MELREFLARVEAAGELQTITGANWNLEIGAITEVSASFADSKALLFDQITGYPKGYRVLTNGLGSQRRSALALDLDSSLTGVALVRALKRKLEELKPAAPKRVSGGSVLENVDSGGSVNVLKFPAPKWHREDGGRYIGTMDAVIVEDPETGWAISAPTELKLRMKKHWACIFLRASTAN